MNKNTKTVVITGSTRGIGKGMALEFLKRGHNVCINGTTKSTLNTAMNDFSKYEGQILGIIGDVTKKSTLEKLFDLSRSHFGSVDIWINNAGISTPNLPTLELDKKDIKKLIDINIKGLTLGSIIAANKMIEQGHGKIFNMEGFGSDGRKMKKMTIYGTSKYAVRYFTRSMAKELSDSGIQIGSISPGMVLTDLLIKPIKDNTKEEQEKAKRIFNILAERTETVCPFLVERMLKNEKNGDHIAYLNNGKIMWRFLRSIFVKRDIMKQ